MKGNWGDNGRAISRLTMGHRESLGSEEKREIGDEVDLAIYFPSPTLKEREVVRTGPTQGDKCSREPQSKITGRPNDGGWGG